MEFVPKYIKQTMDKRDSEIVTSQEWNAILNLLIQQGDHNAKAILDLVKVLADYSTTEELKQLLNQKVFESEAADMTKLVYDPDDDGVVSAAKTLLDNGVKTSTIQNGAVTHEKLETKLGHKITYAYDNIGKVLLLIGADAEIEGTADLVLFGVDGTLESAYNADAEALNKFLINASLASGATTINHRDFAMSSAVSTSKNYTITNGTKVWSTKLSSVTNATLETTTSTQTFNSYDGNNTGKKYIAHLKDNDYVIASSNYYYGGSSSSIIDYTTVYIVRYDTSTKQFNIVTSKNFKYLDLDDIIKIGNYVYVYSKDSDNDINYENVIAVTGTSISDRRDADRRDSSYEFLYCGTKPYIYYEGKDSGESERYFYKLDVSTGVQTQLLETNRTGINYTQVTGQYAFIEVKQYDASYDDVLSTTYYSLNMVTGGLTILDASTDILSWAWKCIPDTDGTHFYCNGTKYKMTDYKTPVKVAEIKDMPDTFTVLNSGVFYESATKKVYIIENNVCKPIYDLNKFGTGPQYSATENYMLTDVAINANATQGMLGYEINYDGSNYYIKPYTFTLGSIKLASALNAAMSGDIYITREHDCTVPAGQSKHIYIKPTTDGNTFKNLNLVLNLNRALATGDTITVVVNGTTLTATAASIAKTKYYEHTFSTAVSDIEVKITITAGSTGTLQVTQVLGGVDNEV